MEANNDQVVSTALLVIGVLTIPAMLIGALLAELLDRKGGRR